jgi:hypothetical protein
VQKSNLVFDVAFGLAYQTSLSVLQTKKGKAADLTSSAKGGRIVFPDTHLSGMTKWATELTQISLDIKAVAGLFGGNEPS